MNVSGIFSTSQANSSTFDARTSSITNSIELEARLQSQKAEQFAKEANNRDFDEPSQCLLHICIELDPIE
jgi:hypothetical protein